MGVSSIGARYGWVQLQWRNKQLQWGDAFVSELSTQFVRGCLVFGHDLAICRSGKCEVVGGGKHPGGSRKTAGLYVADGGAFGVLFLVQGLRKCRFLELGNWGF